MSDIVQQLDLFSATLPKINLKGKIVKLIECLALMGFSKDNYENVKKWSDSALYHCAGDSIVVCVLMALFGELTELDYRTIIKDYIEKEVI